MPDFINTIDLLGDDAVIDSIIERNITEFKDDQITTVGDSAFYNCTLLKEFQAPNLKTVKANAFRGCTSLERFDLPKSENYLDLCSGAFSGCTSLKEFNAPNQTSMLYDTIFYGCVELVKVNMPNINECPLSLFEKCSKLKKLDFNRLSIIHRRAFGGSALEALIIRSENVCALKHVNAFNYSGSTPIANGTGFIYVPGNLVSTYKSAENWSTIADQFRGIIDDEDALQGIIDGTLVDFENSEISKIDGWAFYSYTPLKSIESSSVAEIGESAFEGCTELEDISMPNVITIGKKAFKGCTSIPDLTADQFPNVETIEAGAFEGCSNIQTIDLPTVTLATNLGTSKCTALTSVNLPNLETQNNVGYSLTFALCPNLVSANLPKLEKFSFYGGNEFANCTNLTNVNVPSLVRLGNAGFSKCTSLAKLDLPKVTSIGKNAFEYTPSLIALILRSDSVCTVGVNAFAGTSAIANGTGYIYVPRSLIDSYKTAENWSTYAAQFRALEDYTVDGTITGELDETKI